MMFGGFLRRDEQLPADGFSVAFLGTSQDGSMVLRISAKDETKG